MVLRLAAACVLALFLAACLPDSVNPLTPPEAAHDAPELLGLWQTTVEDATVYLHVLRGDGHRLQIVTVGHEADGSGDIDAYLGHVSDVGGRRFVNVQSASDAAQESPPWWFIAAENTGNDVLFLHFLSTETLADAIVAGRLLGSVENDGLTRSVHLRDDGPRIAAFLAESDPATLFGQTMEFRRVGAAPGSL